MFAIQSLSAPLLPELLLSVVGPTRRYSPRGLGGIDSTLDTISLYLAVSSLGFICYWNENNIPELGIQPTKDAKSMSKDEKKVSRSRESRLWKRTGVVSLASLGAWHLGSSTNKSWHWEIATTVAFGL